VGDEELLRYSRHILLPELGIEGQEKLLASRVLILGLGGLGSPVALYLASSGVGELTLVDHDTVDLTNLQRHIAHDSSGLGQTKVSSASSHLQRLNPGLLVHTHAERASAERLRVWLDGIDLVIDCCDNFATRHVINRVCLEKKIPWVFAGAITMDAQISVFDPRDPKSPCFACLFPEDVAPEEVNCASLGVLAPLVGVMGSLQALEAIKMLAHIGEPLVGRLLMLEARQMRWSEMRLKRQPHCAACAELHAMQATTSSDPAA
jgi:molybdopterin/thiamine biosynthesis adenylyltransferase